MFIDHPQSIPNPIEHATRRDAPRLVPGGADIRRQGALEDLLSRKEEGQILRREMDNLSEQQRVVLSLYYLDELKIRDIADVMGVTASRISQIRLAGVDTILSRLSHLREQAA